MRGYVDVLAMDGWQVVSAAPVNHPKTNLLLLILKCPRDQQQGTPPGCQVLSANGPRYSRRMGGV